MRAVRVTRHGEPSEVVEVQDIEPPVVGPGEVRIAVAAASLNFGDIARARGGIASVMSPPPMTLGMDVCGVIESGDGAVGRRVVAVCKQSFGGMAELAIAPAVSVFDAPPGLDDVEAAAFTLPFHTTYLALHERAALEAGETLVVVGGASALGTAAIQLGVAAGARVIAVAGGPEKAALCSELGAATTIDHLDTADLFDALMAATGGRGADVMVDLVGGDRTETLWTTMARGGRYVPVGFNDDPESGFTGRPLRKVALGNFSVVGVVAAYGEVPLDFRRFGINPFPAATGTRVHAALLTLLGSGAIRPVIGRRIGMHEVGAALEDHEQRRYGPAGA
jgi:NADPH2:quinone reductase